MRERIFKLFAKHGLLSRISNSTLQQEENEKKNEQKKFTSNCGSTSL